jgi:hypothetical protein
LLIFPPIEDCLLRSRAIRISMRCKDNTADKVARWETYKSLFRSPFRPVVWNQMEGFQMPKYLAPLAGAAAVLVLALTLPSSVNAGGGSASAPSKYRNSLVSQQQQQQTKQNFPITEYSSSSRTSSQKH